MMQLIGDAWREWHSYTSDGKFAALLLAALLYLWLARKGREQRPLLAYTAVMTICCIFPPTAALLWLYQTKFYDYLWIWSMVPLTAVTAYGSVLFLEECGDRPKVSGDRRKIPAVLFLLAAVLLCGGLGARGWDRDAQRQETRQAREVLAGVRQQYPEGEICLWAPREILEYAREQDAAIRLAYGRNMWDAALNAYAYDTYDDNMVKIYQWMETVGKGAVEPPQPEDSALSCQELQEFCVSYALSEGVNCILLPQGAGADTLRRMEALSGGEARPTGDYYLFICR